MEETLDEALAAIFGRAPPKQEVRKESVVDEKNIIRQAKEHYDRAQQALRDADWARYGEEMLLLGDVLEQMARE